MFTSFELRPDGTESRPMRFCKHVASAGAYLTLPLQALIVMFTRRELPRRLRIVLAAFGLFATCDMISIGVEPVVPGYGGLVGGVIFGVVLIVVGEVIAFLARARNVDALLRLATRLRRSS